MSSNAELLRVLLFSILVLILANISIAADTPKNLNPKDPSHRAGILDNDSPKETSKIAGHVKHKNSKPTSIVITKGHHPVEQHVPKEESKEPAEDVDDHGQAMKSNKGDENAHHVDKAAPVEPHEKNTIEEENDGHSNEAVEKEKEDSQSNETEEKKNQKPSKKGLGVVKVLKKQGQDNVKGFKLSKQPACVDDIKQLCSNLPKDNNFAVLVCLQDAAAQDDDQVSDDCHALLWEYKKNLTSSVMFDKAAFEVCETFLSEIKYCQGDFPNDGSFVNCLVEHRELAKDQKCRAFLHKMAAIVYSDYRLIKGFYNECHQDVVKYNCGKLSTKTESDPHTQAEVIECLEDNIINVSEKCQIEIKKVAELSSDDYHMDRAIFYACQDARTRFCSTVQAGDGRIYKCLMKHKMEETMAEDCREALTVRQKLMQEDVKVNHPLWEQCEKYFHEFKCERKGETSNGQASHLILCLNEKIADGKDVSAKCQVEMQDFASQLFADYKLNPEVIAHCSHHLETVCKDQLKAEGGALDCLMGLGDQLNQSCYEAVHEVLKETNAGGDFQIDKPLFIKCQPFIETSCKGKSKSLVLSCLMDNMRSESMSQDCQQELFHLQFFLARDFSLDEQLFMDCKDDAKRICNAPDFNAEFTSVPPGIIFACLYRATMKDVSKEHQASPTCGAHVRRLMHARATSVKLMPEIETACLGDLGSFCVGSIKEGEEVKCLQDRYEDLSEKCKGAVANFTEMESEDYELDKDLVNACAPMVIKFCQDVVKDGNPDEVLPCLIKNKHSSEMDLQCTSAVEHWQILELKDIRFSHKLKKACFDDIEKNCPHSKSKLDAVKCLSTEMQKNIKENRQSAVSQECQDQIRAELIEEHEDIVNLDPEFQNACQEDLSSEDKPCHQYMHKGQAKAEECLRQHFESLTQKCRSVLFKVELEEAENPALDYQLTHACKSMLKKHCMDRSPKKYIDCLREHENDVEMTTECRNVLFERKKEGAKDFRLDPDIAEFCKADIHKFCKNIAETDNRGLVMNCLKKQVEGGRLSEECNDYVKSRMEEAALDYRLDPVLEHACADEVGKFCSKEMSDRGHGEIVDCLKRNYKKLLSKTCKEEVKRMIGEGITDIHADPHLVQECNIDIQKYCTHIVDVDGKVVECLLDVYNSKTLVLASDCKKLIRKRMEMWSAVDVTARFQSLNDVISHVHASPNRQYIYTVTLCMLAVIFIGGLCCGRITKRVAREYKDR
ncbi:Golgi apparatus protein 1-like [Rhopilema esculentum]|uniref:Golgi apparatus protein 1-like n=1 Tax=Rhopilema esculentum TaxID=499914 RepID=UPI0031E12C05|eukprot:gene1306-15694_t